MTNAPLPEKENAAIPLPAGVEKEKKQEEAGKTPPATTDKK